DSRILIFSGIGQNCEPAGHLSVHDVGLCAALSSVPLFCEYAEVVSVKGLRRGAGVRVASLFREVTQLIKGQAVLLIFITRVLLHFAARVIPEVVLLRVGKRRSGRDGNQLVSSDATRGNLVGAAPGIEIPLT